MGIQKVDMDLAKSFGLDRPSGALVTEVFPGSAAENAGVLAGDIVTSFNGKRSIYLMTSHSLWAE